MVSVGNEGSLFSIISLAKIAGIRYSFFKEPDLGNSLTAIALGPEGKRLVKKLPLAFGKVTVAEDEKPRCPRTQNFIVTAG